MHDDPHPADGNGTVAESDDGVERLLDPGFLASPDAVLQPVDRTAVTDDQRVIGTVAPDAPQHVARIRADRRNRAPDRLLAVDAPAEEAAPRWDVIGEKPCAKGAGSLWRRGGTAPRGPDGVASCWVTVLLLCRGRGSGLRMHENPLLRSIFRIGQAPRTSPRAALRDRPSRGPPTRPSEPPNPSCRGRRAAPRRCNRGAWCNRGGRSTTETRTRHEEAGEVAEAWLLSQLDGGGWTEAEALEAVREAAGVSARALTTARGRLVEEGRVEKRKAGRGAWSYRLVGRAPGPRPAPELEAAPAPGRCTVPARFAAMARLLAGAPMAAPELPELRVAVTLMKLAEDCGYTLESCRLAPAREVREAP